MNNDPGEHTTINNNDHPTSTNRIQYGTSTSLPSDRPKRDCPLSQTRPGTSDRTKPSEPDNTDRSIDPYTTINLLQHPFLPLPTVRKETVHSRRPDRAPATGRSPANQPVTRRRQRHATRSVATGARMTLNAPCTSVGSWANLVTRFPSTADLPTILRLPFYPTINLFNRTISRGHAKWHPSRAPYAIFA